MQFRLNFEGVKVERPLDFYYEVYLNLPDNIQDPKFTDGKLRRKPGVLWRRRKRMRSMARRKSRNSAVNISGALKRLRALQRQKTITVTLVPTALETRAGSVCRFAPRARVTVEQVSLIAEEPRAIDFVMSFRVFRDCSCISWIILLLTKKAIHEYTNARNTFACFSPFTYHFRRTPMIIRIIFLACLSLIFSSNVLGQTCETRYRSCVRTCNLNRDQALAPKQPRTKPGQDSTGPGSYSM